MIKNEEINYKVIILCFPNSYKIKGYFDNYPYVISFEYFNISLDIKEHILKQLNKAFSEFIINFIKNITNENLYNEINNIFELSKQQFLEQIKSIKNDINCKDYIILSNNKNPNLKIEYLKEIQYKELILYEPLIKYNNANIIIKEDEDIQKYASQIYDIIQKIKYENKIIYYSNESKKMKYLKTCIEVMKFYYRHKAYNELYCIDIKQEGKTLLKSIIRKYTQLNDIDDEKSEEYEEEQRKNCLILIYNCYLTDLLDINFYTLLNNNSSFIIIYENYKYTINNLARIEKIEEKDMNAPSLDIYENLGNLDNKYTIFEIKNKTNLITSYTVINNACKIKYVMDIKNGKQDFPRNKIDSLKKLSIINNPYILKFIEYGKGKLLLNNSLFENAPYIIYENVLKYNLLDFIREKGFSEDYSKIIFKKIVLGIKAIHDNNLCHRNINTDNVLFDEYYNPKIYGFDFCCENKIDFQKQVGKIHFSSPEILHKIKYDGKKSDIFSLGHLLFCLVTGMFGFQSSERNDIYYKCIIKKKFEKYWEIHPYKFKKDLSENFKNLYLKMVAYDPFERPSIDEILFDDWMKEINCFSSEENLEKDFIEELEKRKLNIKKDKFLTKYDSDEDRLILI